MSNKVRIMVEVSVKAPIDKIWRLWESPSDIAIWNNINMDWHCPRVENDLVTGGSFFFRMETKDGKEGFDYKGNYDKVDLHKAIELTGSDGRKTSISFDQNEEEVNIMESFEPDKQTPLDVQENFTQSILNNFKIYVEEGKLF